MKNKLLDKFLKLILKLIESLFSTQGYEVLYELNLKKSIDKIENYPEVKIIELKHLSNISEIAQNANIDLNIYKALIERGDVGFGYFIDNKMVSFHWLQLSGLHYIQSINKHIPIQKGDAWIYNVKVHPHYQGLGINGKVMRFIATFLIQKGLNRILIYTKYTNVNQQKSLKKFGFRTLDKLRYKLIFKKYYIHG